MPYVFNLKSKTLAPLPSHPGADPMEFVSKEAIVVNDEQARMIGKADAAELEKITMHILGKRLLRDQSMSAEHLKLLEAGMKALGTDDLSEVAKDKPKVEDKLKVEEDVEEETLSMTLDTGNSSALLSKAQVSRIRSHSTILKYAREVLGLDVLDNETFEVLKRKVLAHQFGEEV